MSRGVLVELISVEEFRELMTARDVSVRDLAESAEVSPALISHLRSEQRVRRVSVARAERIAKALDVEPSDLFRVPDLDELVAAYTNN